jgi:hypothetical protein
VSNGYARAGSDSLQVRDHLRQEPGKNRTYVLGSKCGRSADRFCDTDRLGPLDDRVSDLHSKCPSRA